ncbi:MAG: response regulator transcription factor [Bacteroidota bacterium]
MNIKLRILMVEDLQIVREGIKVLLSSLPNALLIGECKNGREFLEFIENKMPDVVLIDIKMPVMNGLEAIEAAQKLYPDIKFVILSSCDEEEYLMQALKLGVKGYLLKTTNEEELWKAVTNVYEGRSYFTNELLTTLSNCFVTTTNQKKEKETMMEELTKREMEILYLIVNKGYSNKKIAEICFISPRTAGGHRASILKKTGSRSTPELILNAYKNNIIGQDGKFNLEK